MNREILISEIKLVSIMGIFPTLLSYMAGQAEGLKLFIEAATVTYVLFGYFLFAFLLHVVVAGYVKFHAWCAEDTHKQKIKYLFGFTGPLSEGLLGIYRVSSGALLVLPILWKYHEPDTIELYQVVALEVIGLAFFFGTYSISSVAKWAEKISNNLIKSTPKSGAPY